MLQSNLNHTTINQNIIYVKNPDMKHEIQLYSVANAQLFDSSEKVKVSSMSIIAVNIAAPFHIFIHIIGHNN